MDRFAIGAALREIADWLELDGDRSHRPRAYRRGAAGVEATKDLDRLMAEGRLTSLPGIGDALAKLIVELAQSGRSRYLEKLRAGRPSGLLELRSVGLSARRIGALHAHLGVRNLDELGAALADGRVETVPGFGPKTAQKLTEQIRAYRARGEQMILARASAVADELSEYLSELEPALRIQPAGGLRRACEVVDEVVLVAESTDPAALLRSFVEHPAVVHVEQISPDAAIVRRSDGLRARLHLACPGALGTTLLRATGDRSHVARLEALGASVEGKADEAAIYASAGLPFIPPELREAAGSIDAALAGERFDDLVRLEDLRGLVHCHTTYSDGAESIEGMARAAEALGASYLTITDHSVSARYAGGLDLDRLRKQWDEIDEVQARVPVRILRGAECDITRDGALDYPDPVLERLDVVIASVHERFQLDAEAMTARVERAMRHPVFKIWGHALGRLLLRREPYACDVERIFDAIAESRAAIEINGDPFRMDLPPMLIPAARRRGIRFVISSDAHSAAGLANMRWGVRMARRGGVRRAEVLNALPVAEFTRAVRPAV